MGYTDKAYTESIAENDMNIPVYTSFIVACILFEQWPVYMEEAKPRDSVLNRKN